MSARSARPNATPSVAPSTSAADGRLPRLRQGLAVAVRGSRWLSGARDGCQGSRWVSGVRDAEVGEAAEVEEGVRGGADHAEQDRVAVGAAGDHAGRVDVQPGLGEDAGLAAAVAPAERRGQVDGEQLAQRAGSRIAVEVGLCHRGPPVGPNRSVLTFAGSCPAATKRSATVSTNGVGPQTYVVAPSSGLKAYCSIRSASIRPTRGSPGGASRV